MKNLILTFLFVLAGVVALGQGYFIRPRNQDQPVPTARNIFDRGTDGFMSMKSTPAVSVSSIKAEDDFDVTIFFKDIDGKNFWGRNYLGGIRNDKDSSLILASNIHLGFTSGVTGLIYTEFLSSRIGKAKVSFGSVLANAKDDTIKTTQQFLNGGGNGIIRAALPLYYTERSRTDSYLAGFTMFLMPRLSLNLPKANDTSVLRDWNIDLGWEAHGVLSSADNNLGLVGKIRIAGVYGSTDFTEKIVKDQQVFGYVQASFGVLLLKNFVIQVNVEPLIWGDKVQGIPSTIGVQTRF
jgi:hypothetical protein